MPTTRDVSACKAKFIVPPQEGGVDYKRQYEMLQIANLVLADQITLL